MSRGPRPLIATFCPEVWDGDYAVPVGPVSEFDATQTFLALSLQQIRAINESGQRWDVLRGDFAPEHTGPFRIIVDIDQWLDQEAFLPLDLMTQLCLDNLRELFPAPRPALSRSGRGFDL